MADRISFEFEHQVGDDGRQIAIARPLAVPVDGS